MGLLQKLFWHDPTKDEIREYQEENEKMREAERNEAVTYVRSLDKYLGNVADYSTFKREPFEEINLADPKYCGKWERKEKWVQAEWSSDFYGTDLIRDMGLILRLKDVGECVALVHYIPLQWIGCDRYGRNKYIGGYGTPVKRKESKT